MNSAESEEKDDADIIFLNENSSDLDSDQSSITALPYRNFGVRKHFSLRNNHGNKRRRRRRSGTHKFAKDLFAYCNKNGINVITKELTPYRLQKKLKCTNVFKVFLYQNCDKYGPKMLLLKKLFEAQNS